MKFNISVTTVDLFIEILDYRNELAHNLRKESDASKHYEDDKNSLRFVNWKQISVTDCCQSSQYKITCS